MNIFSIGKDLLLGSVVVAAPVATVAYILAKPMVVRYHLKHPPRTQEADDSPVEPP